MSTVPLLVIGGYLGAGKTTLVRHLLTDNHGQRLLVLVNDFGAINIDAEMIAQADGDVIALTNGCVCCTTSGDLFYAVGDALDRQPRPDMIVIEASGVSDPARIATLALAEPDLSYAGIVTVVDAGMIDTLLADEQIGAQLRQQIACGDLIALSRTDEVDGSDAAALIGQVTDAPIVDAPHGRIDTSLLLNLDPQNSPAASDRPDHAAQFVSWNGQTAALLPAETWRAILRQPYEGLYRLKGYVTDETGSFVVQRVSDRFQIKPSDPRRGSQLVAIGPAGRFDPSELEWHWQALISQCQNQDNR